MVLVADAISQAAHLGKKPGPTLDGFASVELRNHHDVVPVWDVHGERERQPVRGVPM